MITRKYYKLIRVSYSDSDLFRITNISDQVGTLTVTNTDTAFEYSTDGVNWSSYTGPITVPAGGNCYMKANGGISGISMDVDYNVGGNACSLLDKTNYANITILPQGAFQYLFQNDTHLVDASNMNFGNAYEIGYASLRATFQGCTSLTGCPDFSNFTTIGSRGLSDVFRGCTSLTTGPDITNITTLNSGFVNPPYRFENMLRDCTLVNTVYAPNLSTWDAIDMNAWLLDVSATGTLYCPSQATYNNIPDNSRNGCPSGWTKVVM